MIGIINRIDKTQNNDVYVFNKEICDFFIKRNVVIVGVINYDINLLNLCNGFILPGGDFETLDKDIIDYAYKTNKPLLGICLGMQSMGEYFNGNLIKTNHKNYHQIIIKKDSKLYSILKKRILLVNSRHKYVLEKTDLDVSSLYENNIESIEDKSKLFFIGLQWHPESLNNKESSDIFNAFLEACVKNEFK